MSIRSRVRHSVVGRFLRKLGHRMFMLHHRSGEPVGYSLPGRVDLKLQPRGDVAGWLWYAPFFERRQLRFVAALLRPGMRVVDVGANAGLYSILAGRLVGDEGQVWALEPSSDTFSLLLENLELNAPLPVTPLRVALGDAPKTMRLVSESGFGDAYRYVVDDSASSVQGESVWVATLDTLDAEHSLAPVDFIKLDIEGGELLALRGARRVLESSERVVIMFESDPEWCKRSGYRREEVVELLRSLGFGIYSWSARLRRWQATAGLPGEDMLWAARDAHLLPIV